MLPGEVNKQEYCEREYDVSGSGSDVWNYITQFSVQRSQAENLPTQ